MRLKGIVSSGLGRAHIFMAQHHYQEQFKTIIGRTAWPGTLNIAVAGDSLTEYRKLRVSAGLDEVGESSDKTSYRINGFDRDGVSFGGATAFLATIESNSSSIRINNSRIRVRTTSSPSTHSKGKRRRWSSGKCSR